MAPLSALLQRDVAVERDLQLQARHFERHAGRQRLGAGNGAAGKSRRDGPLDLSLRAHADHLQKLANAQIECFFVHEELLLFRRGRANAAKLATRNSILAGGSVRGQLPGFVG